MLPSPRAIFALILISATVYAAAPIAEVSSSEPFTLRGSEVPVAGGPSWPVFSGDELVAGQAPAMVKLRCGTRIWLNPGSQARISAQANATIRLLKGTLTYNVSDACAISIGDGSGAPVAAQAAGTAALAHDGIRITPRAARGDDPDDHHHKPHPPGHQPPPVSPSR